MILGGSLLGMSIMASPSPIPSPTTYDKVEIYGDCIVDKVRYLSKELTDLELDALLPTDTYSWIPETILYAEFNDSLSAGNIGGVINPILSWDIFRKKIDDTTYVKIDNIPVSNTEYYDYEVKGGYTYQYRVYAKSATELSDPLNTPSIYTDFRYWALMNYDNPSQVWIFELDLETGAISVNTDMNVTDAQYTAMPSVTFSEKHYISGQIKATGGYIQNSDMLYTNTYIDELDDFINNKQAKILKNKYGQAWKVVTDGLNYKFNDSVREQISEISFNFTQVGTINS